MPALNETVSVSRRTHRALATRTVGDKMPLVWQPEHRDQSFGNLSDGHHKSGAATEDRLRRWAIHPGFRSRRCGSIPHFLKCLNRQYLNLLILNWAAVEGGECHCGGSYRNSFGLIVAWERTSDFNCGIRVHWTVLILLPSPYKTICKKILIAE